MVNEKKDYKVYFVYGNHDNFEILEDFFYIVEDFVKFVLGKNLYPVQFPVQGEWNIVVECFNNDWVERLQNAKRKKGTRIFCICTELVTGNTFNLFKKEVSQPINIDIYEESFVIDLGKGRNMLLISKILEKISHHKWIGFPLRQLNALRYSNLKSRVFALEKKLKLLSEQKKFFLDLINEKNESEEEADNQYEKNDYFKERFRWFKKSLPYIDMIWCLTPFQVEDYKTLVKELGWEDLPTWYLPIQPYQDIKKEKNAEQFEFNEMDIDILFTGTLTRYREKILIKLQKKGYCVVYENQKIPSYARKNLLARSKICIHILPHSDWKYSSPIRIHSLLMGQKIIVAEVGQTKDCIQLEFVRVAESAHFINTIEEILRDFQSYLGSDAYNKYKNSLILNRERIRNEFLEIVF